MEGSFPINEEARRLFYSLLARATAGKFDEAFLIELVRYHKAFPESERYEALYARYALAQDAPLVAIEYGEKAYQRRPFSPAIWNLMADIYRALDRPLEAARFEAWRARWEEKAGADELRREMAAEIAEESAAVGGASLKKAATDEGKEAAVSPEAKERRYEVELSALPGAPLCLRVRTKSHEFHWETTAHIAFDGRVDRSRFFYRLYAREETAQAVRDAAMEQRFLGIAERYTRALADNGEFWPEEGREHPKRL